MASTTTHRDGDQDDLQEHAIELKMDKEGSNERTNVSTWTREKCPQCEQSAKYYCPRCCHVLGVPTDVTVPNLRLPLQVDIWFQDKIKKSTAPHAKVLAPKDVEIMRLPLSHDTLARIEYDPERVVVVYPTVDATTLPDMDAAALAKIDTLVFIDTPWQKAPVTLKHSKLAHLSCVKLANPPKESKFWRYHHAGAGCVSTIEAILCMLEEYKDAMKQANLSVREKAATTDLNQLLFFFDMMYSQISEHYEEQIQDVHRMPMTEEEKQRQAQRRDQKEVGKKRRLENKRDKRKRLELALANGEIASIPRDDRCYNCKKPGHESKQCPEPCRYRKRFDHFSGTCPMKRVRYEESQRENVPITHA